MELKQVKKCDIELWQFNETLLPSKELIMLDGRKQDFRMHSISLYKAALRGDWDTSRRIQKEHPNCFLEKLSKYGDNALHIASAAKRSYFIKRALEQAMITADQLEYQNSSGNTAFHLAAASGALEIVLEMERHNPGLPYLQGSNSFRPIHMAAMLGHRDVVLHLLPPCFPHLSQDERIMLIISTINTELYDVALEIIRMDSSLSMLRNENGETPIHVLARKPRKQAQGLLQNTWMCFSGISREENARVQLIKRIWNQLIKQSETPISDILSSPQPKLLFSAIEIGNLEFVNILVQSYPDLIWEVDEDNRTIFHAAVKFRQERIFAHIFHINGIGHLLAAQTERNTGNNILHLVATLPPMDRLNLIPGPALKLQRELLWFQVVKDFVSPEFANMKNSKGETPQDLFIKEHRELRSEGEQWMRKTAIANLILASVFAVIAFEAIFQLPKTDHIPNSSSSSALPLYVISLLTSISSILTFATILSSRFVQEDFLISLPLKLLVGNVFLFLAMATLFAASAAIALPYFPQKIEWVLTVIFAGMTFIFYIQHHIPLLVNVFCSTFGYRYLFLSRCPLC